MWFSTVAGVLLGTFTLRDPAVRHNKLLRRGNDCIRHLISTFWVRRSIVQWVQHILKAGQTCRQYQTLLACHQQKPCPFWQQLTSLHPWITDLCGNKRGDTRSIVFFDSWLWMTWIAEVTVDIFTSFSQTNTNSWHTLLSTIISSSPAREVFKAMPYLAWLTSVQSLLIIFSN